MGLEDCKVSAECLNHVEIEMQPQQQDQQQFNESNDELALDFPLMQQSSIYSLTLDEIQNTVFEPNMTFGSMNIEELLSSIWSTEETDITNNSAPVANVVPAIDNIFVTGTSAHDTLQQQGSHTVPTVPLCKKTVDELWTEIHRDNQPIHQLSSSSCIHNASNADMTLEEFLVKVGVLWEAKPPMAPLQQLPQQLMLPELQLPHESTPMEFSGHGVSYNGTVEGSSLSVITTPVGFGVSQFSNNSGAMVSSGSKVGGRKRGAADMELEKVVERKQKKMMKNRESAARSRARKQAYTMELEAKINQLREENAHLGEVMRHKQPEITVIEVEEAKEIEAKARKNHRRTASWEW